MQRVQEGEAMRRTQASWSLGYRRVKAARPPLCASMCGRGRCHSLVDRNRGKSDCNLLSTANLKADALRSPLTTLSIKVALMRSVAVSRSTQFGNDVSTATRNWSAE